MANPIVIVDLKLGNLRSIANSFTKAGSKPVISDEPKVIKQASKIVLPGVGSFEQGMKNLEESGLIDLLTTRVIDEGVPTLGICLGMQLLANWGEEGEVDGLGWIKGKVKKFAFTSEYSLRVPHVGWNTIRGQKTSPLLQGLEDMPRFYFTHSYHFICENPENSLALTSYGYNFTSIVHKNNLYGVQFHPETSHSDGIRLLKNFIGIQ